MKVLFSLTYYTPYISGLTIYVTRIAKLLANRGVDVTVLTSQHDKTLSCHSEEILHIIRVPYLLKISKGFIMPSYIWESYKAVQNSDVVFINLPQAEGFIVALWAKILRKKLHAIYHCDLVLPAGFFNKLINKIVIFCNFITLKLSDKIIIYTNEYAESSPHLRRFVIASEQSERGNLTSNKIATSPSTSLRIPRNDKNKTIQIFPPVYPLPVDEKYFQELVKKYVKDNFKIGFAARIAEEKGLEYLIESLQNTDNLKLFIAGPKEEVAGEEKYIEKINKLLEENKDKIVFLGNLNERQMGAFYKFIDLLIVSSVNRTEAFGLVQAEAMFAEKPVVATNLPGVKFLVENTGAGEICQIKNSGDLKEKIEMVKKNYAIYQEKTKNIFGIIDLKITINEFLRLLS